MTKADAPHREPIAIVGMDCVFPGARNLAEFWSNNVLGVDAIREVPASRWDPDEYELRCRRGGFIDGLTEFDPFSLKVMPASVEEGDAEQFLVASIIQRALWDVARGRSEGGVDLDWVPHERTEVVVGRGGYIGNSVEHVHLRIEVIREVLRVLSAVSGGIGKSDLAEIRKRLIEALPPVTAETVAASVPNLCSGRATNRLDLMGSSYVVDAACASGLIAVDHIVTSLRNGRSDLGIAAAVHLIQKPGFWFVFQTLDALSQSGEIRPFAKDADGLLIGEGLGAIVMKRLSDAERDGNTIYALIHGVGVASDGRGAGIMTPRLEGERLAIERAWEETGLSPSVVSMIEGHGTALSVGDAIEIRALRGIFDGGSSRRVALGSVKSMIGHTMPAAGIAGMIRTALSLHHRIRPATLHVDEPHPDLAESRIFVNTETSPWILRADEPRVAAVNAFGFGGINAHVVLQEAPEQETPNLLTPWDVELFLFSADDRAGLIREINDWMGRDLDALGLADLSFSSVSRFSRDEEVRLAIVSRSTADLRRLLTIARERVETDSEPSWSDRSGIFFGSRRVDGKIIALFPGIGFPGVAGGFTERLGELCMRFPEVRKVIDEADELISGVDPDGVSAADQFFPPPLLDRKSRLTIEKDLAWSNRTPIALLMTYLATWSLAHRLGLRPDAFIGFSLGELGALAAGGSLDLSPERRGGRAEKAWSLLSETRIEEGEAGLWAMVSASEEKVLAMFSQVEGTVGIAMDVSPNQVFIGGEVDAVRAVLEKLREEGIWSQELPQLPMLAPFLQVHTELAEKMASRYESLLDAFLDAPLQRPVYSGSSGELYPESVEEMRKVVLSSMSSPVAIRKAVDRLYDDGFRIFVQLGSGRALLHNVQSTLGLRPHVAVSIDREHTSGLEHLLGMMGELLAAGAELDPMALFRNRRCEDALQPGETKGKARILSLSQPKFELSDGLIESVRSVVGGGRIPDFSEILSLDAADVNPPSIEEIEVVLDRYLAMEEESERREIAMLERFIESRISAPSNEGGVAIHVPKPDVTPVVTGWPLVGELVEAKPGVEMTTRLVLDLDEHLFLHHHAFLNVPDGLKPLEELLPTLPLVFGIEVMAECAQVLTPDRQVTGVHSVRATKWISLQSSRQLAVSIRTRRVSDLDVEVELIPDGEERPSLAGLVSFEKKNDRPEPLAVTIDVTPKHTAEEFYRDGPLFHGPMFHVITALDGLAESGAVATLRVDEMSAWFAKPIERPLIFDPMILDGLGQIIGYHSWLNGRLVLPVGFERLTSWSKRPSTGSRLRGVIKVMEKDDRFLTVDMEVLDGEGRVWMKMEGWKDWRIVPPPNVVGGPNAARRSMVASPVEADGGAEVNYRLAARELGNVDAAWVARVYLQGADWESWSREGRVDWLLERVVAKDCVRGWYRSKKKRLLHPLEVDLVDIGAGVLQVTTPGEQGLKIAVHREGLDFIATVK